MKKVFFPGMVNSMQNGIEKNQDKIIFFLLSISCFVLLIERLAGIFIVSPDPWNIIENNVIYGIQRLLKGFLLYADPEQPPYSITQYAPIYYYIISGLCRLCHVSADDLLSVYKISRAVSLLFNLLFCSMTAMLCYRILKIPVRIVVSAGMACFLLLYQHAYSRPDSLYNLNVLLTIYCYILYLEKKDVRSSYLYIILASFFAVAGIFTKQSGILLPPLLLFYQLFILRKIDGVIILTGALAAFAGIFLLVFIGQSNLLLFYKNVVLGLNNGFSIWWLFTMICSVQGFLLMPIYLYGSFLLLRSGKHITIFTGLSIFALFSFAFMTSFKQGSTPSYFTESTAVGLAAILFIRDKIKIPALLVIFLLFPALFVQALNPAIVTSIQGKEKFSLYAYNKEYEVYRYIMKNGYLLEDEFIFIDMPASKSFMTGIFYEKGLFPQKDILDQKIVFDYAGFAKLKKNSKIKYVIALQPKPSYLNVTFSDYQVVSIINGYYIMKRSGS